MYDSTQPPASQSGHRAIAVVGVELTLNMQYQHQKDQIILATGRGTWQISAKSLLKLHYVLCSKKRAKIQTTSLR